MPMKQSAGGVALSRWQGGPRKPPRVIAHRGRKSVLEIPGEVYYARVLFLGDLLDAAVCRARPGNRPVKAAM